MDKRDRDAYARKNVLWLSAAFGGVLVLGLLQEKTMVDANVIQTPFSRNSMWKMNVPRVLETDDKSTTALWRTEKRCQFKPNVNAVIELLDVLGFSNVEIIKPRQKNLEFRYYRGKRVTFLAKR